MAAYEKSVRLFSTRNHLLSMNSNNSASTSASILEPARQLTLYGTYDVVVAGGGIAGVAAAVAAARSGASVLLLERSFGLGGLATLGNVTVWLPICDGMGRQIIGGIAAELLHLSVRDLKEENQAAGFSPPPACWTGDDDPDARRKKRYLATFNPAAYLLALEEWVLAAGVKLLYDTRVCQVVRRDEAISHLIIENKSGRSAVACGSVVDASGDADICYFAGEATESLGSNVAAGWFYYLLENRPQLYTASQAYSKTLSLADLDSPGYHGDNGDEVTAQIVASREMLRRDLARLATQHPDRDLQPFAPPLLACFRATRRLVGQRSLSESDMHHWFPETLCLTGDWRRRGPVFAITLEMLRGVCNRNLITAGRCISADTTIWDCTRAIPTCAVTGEVAGLAAATAARNHAGDLAALPIAALQEQLRRNGNLLTPALAAPAAVVEQ